MTRAELTRAPLAAAVHRAMATAGPEATTGLWPDLVRSAPTGADWVPAAELADPDSRALTGLLELTADLFRVPPHAAAALAWKQYAYWVTLPGVLCWTLERCVPRVDLDRVTVRLQDRPPYVTVALTRLDPAPGDGPAELAGALRGTLVEGHLAPVVAALRHRTRVGRRPLWGSVAESLVHPLPRLAPLAGRDPRGDAAVLLRGVGPPVEGLVDLVEAPDGRLRTRRHTCCLAFLGPELGYCSSCCVPA